MVNIPIIAIPNKRAFTTALAFLPLDCLEKNETVNGIIGNTQGVNNAAKPAVSAIQIKLASPPLNKEE